LIIIVIIIIIIIIIIITTTITIVILCFLFQSAMPVALEQTVPRLAHASRSTPSSASKETELASANQAGKEPLARKISMNALPLTKP
jgi:flagellar basal body-associated protein FliL